MDHDTVARDDALGSAKIPLNTLRKDEEKIVTVKLEGSPILHEQKKLTILCRSCIWRSYLWINN